MINKLPPFKGLSRITSKGRRFINHGSVLCWFGNIGTPYP